MNVAIWTNWLWNRDQSLQIHYRECFSASFDRYIRMPKITIRTSQNFENFCYNPSKPNVYALNSDTHTLFLSILLLYSQWVGVANEDIDIWYMRINFSTLPSWFLDLVNQKRKEMGNNGILIPTPNYIFIKIMPCFNNVLKYLAENNVKHFIIISMHSFPIIQCFCST